jgi:choice-of-anchor C domain-containing protein
MKYLAGSLNITAGFIAVLALAGCSKAPENLVKNGSFEDGKDPGAYETLSPGANDITNWTITRKTVDYIGTYFPCGDGKRCIDMDGTPGFGGVSQTFATTPGTTYVVRFELGANIDGPPDVKKLGVTAAGKKAEYDHPSNHDWISEKWQFAATGTQTTLEFYSMDTDGGSTGPMLDNVSVVREN